MRYILPDTFISGYDLESESSLRVSSAMDACDDKAREEHHGSAETRRESDSWLQLELSGGEKPNSPAEQLGQHQYVRSIQLLTPSLTPREVESFLSETGHKYVYTRLGKDGASAITSQAVPASLPSGKRTRQHTSYKTAKKDFLHSYPEYKATEATTGKLLAKEYGLLLGGQETYADYGGGGQPMRSVLRAANRFTQTHIMGNPHSSNNSSSRSSHYESIARTSALRFLGADPQQYTLIWTANASAALGLVRQHYFDDVRRRGEPTTVVMCEDMHNSVNGIRTIVAQDAILAKLVTIVFLPMDLCTLRIDAELFYNVTRKLKTFERGLVLLTAQSNVCGVLHPYSSLLRHAKSNGWDTLLDAAALLPTSPLDLASHPEIDAIPISWYKIVGQPCFGALLVSNAFYSRLHKPHFAGGTVTRVGNATVDDFALAEGAERFHDGTIPYSAFPQLYLALENFNRPRIRQEVALRVRCLIQWLTEGLLTLRWTETNHPLVRVAGFPYLSSDWSRHGATIGLVFYDSAGNRTPFAPIFERLKLFGIDLRSGCMCNTLGILANPGLLDVQSPPCRWLYERTSDTWRLFPLSDYPAEAIAADHGVVRISLGTPSTFEDVYRIYEFAKSLLSYPLGKDDDLVVAKKQVAFKPLQALQRSYSRWLTFDLLRWNGV